MKALGDAKRVLFGLQKSVEVYWSMIGLKISQAKGKVQTIVQTHVNLDSKKSL